MIISYNWLNEYLPNGQEGMPEKADPQKLGKILTSIGLEVENITPFEEVKGGLLGLIAGEVTSCEKHPSADKLRLTTVDIGQPHLLQIVCGATNVAAGQKVVVAVSGTLIHPVNGSAITIKNATIRGIESQGMICSEDEIGLGNNHDGILVLPADTRVGNPVAELFQPYHDHIFEIGLTPNRSDAMSHLGVAQDICAYLSHHYKKDIQVRSPFTNSFKPGTKDQPIEVEVINAEACPRYAGVSIQGVTIGDSPLWLRQRLKSIGLRPVNNIVDITNFILHETGQPLHAFDADSITGKKIVIQNLPEGTPFVTLDGKERKLSASDIMICNGDKPMCIGGVFGGLESGVNNNTRNIFLESAWFDPATIRKTSFRHGLRTDAATRFEKGVDIGNTVNTLKRAATLIKEIAGGEMAGNIIDIYPSPRLKKEVSLKYHYLKKLSGKNYHPGTVKNILSSLGFEIIREGIDEMSVKVPFSKPDIHLPADIVEEIMRIDGLDNVEIPLMITIAPAVETLSHEENYREKISSYLAGSGLREIFTNSITNSAYFSEEVMERSVKMINNLSEELNMLRPSMLESGLETVAFNLNRKNTDLQLFEFGKTYSVASVGNYTENNHLSVYITGNKRTGGWNSKAEKADLYFAKGICGKIITAAGLSITSYETAVHPKLNNCTRAMIGNEEVAIIGLLAKEASLQFDIRQPLIYMDLDWDTILRLNRKKEIIFKEIPKFPAVHRDLAIVVDKQVLYQQIEKITNEANIPKLTGMQLFDVFENEKLGAGRKSMAISFTFVDEEKTMTDKDTDALMTRIILLYEKQLNASVRK